MAHAIVHGLRRAGIDIVTTTNTDLCGQPDAVQLAHAHEAGRVMVTQDRDYLRLAGAGSLHSGVAYCRQGSRSIGEIIDTLILIFEVYSADEMVGRVEYL